MEIANNSIFKSEIAKNTGAKYVHWSGLTRKEESEINDKKMVQNYPLVKKYNYFCFFNA